MSANNKKCAMLHMLRHILVPVFLFSMALPLAAAEFVPYPGKREARLVDVTAPDRVVLLFNTDSTGFTRTLEIQVPGITLAQDTPRASDCERAAAARAMGVTRDFLSNASRLYVKDVRMQNSADDYATSEVLSDQGSLAQALVDAGVAVRGSADGVDWCALAQKAPAAAR